MKRVRSVEIRRRTGQGRHKKNSHDCCIGCKRELRPWHYAEEHMRYVWKKLDLRLEKGKHCICFSGSGSPTDLKKTQEYLLNEHRIETRISKCNGNIKIELISNGVIAERKWLEQNERKAEMNRLRAIEEEKLKIPNFLSFLKSLKGDEKFPFCYLSDLSEHEMNRQEKPGEGAAPSEIFQLYILRLKDGGIYVGETSLGYPWRVYNHIRGHKASDCTENNLSYGHQEWEKNLIQDLMDIIQPINKKYPCTHVFEWWLQQQMLKRKIWLRCGIAKAGIILWDKTCHTCNNIAKENNVPWES